MIEHLLIPVPADHIRDQNHLDVTFVSEEGLLFNAEVIVNSALSDHHTVKMNVKSKYLNEKEKKDVIMVDHDSLETLDQNTAGELAWRQFNKMLKLLLCWLKS